MYRRATGYTVVRVHHCITAPGGSRLLSRVTEIKSRFIPRGRVVSANSSFSPKGPQVQIGVSVTRHFFRSPAPPGSGCGGGGTGRQNACSSSDVQCKSPCGPYHVPCAAAQASHLVTLCRSA